MGKIDKKQVDATSKHPAKAKESIISRFSFIKLIPITIRLIAKNIIPRFIRIFLV